MNKQLRWSVVKLIRLNSPDHGGFINDRCEMRQQLTDPLSALAILSERKLSSQNLGHTLDERESLAFQKRGRAILHMQLLQIGLVFEKLKLRRRARHVEINHSLRPRRQHRCSRAFGCFLFPFSRRNIVFRQQGLQCHGADAKPCCLQKMSSRLIGQSK